MFAEHYDPEEDEEETEQVVILNNYGYFVKLHSKLNFLDRISQE